MFNTLRQQYADHIAHIEHLITDEMSYWDWSSAPQMKDLILRYLTRSGKRLRPLLALLFADLYGGQLEAVHWPAAAIEVYHTATLIYDDIQDNSEFRRGLPCAHITSSTSMAMNLAALTRTLMYHFLHRSPHFNAEQKLAIHERLDHAATLVALGQSIDIGWHEGWYSGYQVFPYQQMIKWKSAVLFGCTAAIGASLSGADPTAVNQAEQIGEKIGTLFQMVDDYLDIFGNPEIMRRPLFNDFREGKVTYPVIQLLYQLSSRGKREIVEHILNRLAERNTHEANWQWLVDLMFEFNIDQFLRGEFLETVEHLTRSIDEINGKAEAQEGLRKFIVSLTLAVSIL